MSACIAPRSRTREDANIPSLSRLRVRGGAPWMAPALRSEERGRGRGSFASLAGYDTKAVSCALWARELLFSAWPEKSSQKRGHPDGAPSAHPWAPGTRAGYGVFRRDSCPGEKLARIPAGHPADFPPPARRAIGAPGEAARSCAQKQRHPTPTLPCMQGRVTTGSRRLVFAPASGAHDERPLLRAPSAAVSRGREGRAAGEVMDDLAFSRGQEPARKARPRLTDFPPTDGRKAPPRGVVSSWLLLLWTSKGEVTRAAAAARNRFESGGSRARAPLPRPLSHKWEREKVRRPRANPHSL